MAPELVGVRLQKEDEERPIDYDLTDSDIHKFLPYFPVLRAQDMRHSAPSSRSLATWPDQMPTHC